MTVAQRKHMGPGPHPSGTPQAVHAGGIKPRLPRPQTRTLRPKMPDYARERFIKDGLPEADWPGIDYGPGPTDRLAGMLNGESEERKQAFRDEVASLREQYPYAWRKLRGVQRVYDLPPARGAEYRGWEQTISLNDSWFGRGSDETWEVWQNAVDTGHLAPTEGDIVRGILRHEFAHHLDHLMTESGYDTDALLVQTVSGLMGVDGARFGSIAAAFKHPEAVRVVGEQVSGYATALRSEMFAEMFVRGGDADAHPALHAFRAAVDREMGGAWFDAGPDAAGMTRRPEALQ